MLLFFRVALTKTLSWMLLFTGWYLVAFIVIIGPAAVERPERGPYFGPTGYWLVPPFVFGYSHSHPVLYHTFRCWITSGYPHQQFYFEYFLVCYLRSFSGACCSRLCRSFCPQDYRSSFMPQSCFAYVETLSRLAAAGACALSLTASGGYSRSGGMLSTAT